MVTLKGKIQSDVRDAEKRKIEFKQPEDVHISTIEMYPTSVKIDAPGYHFEDSLRVMDRYEGDNYFYIAGMFMPRNHDLLGKVDIEGNDISIELEKPDRSER